jgi:alpha-L-rhamnosidase
MRRRSACQLTSCIPSAGLKFLGLILGLVSGLSLTPATGATETTAPVITLQRLRCEYLVDPLGLDTARPRLDWILAATGETPRHLSQASYHILVASSAEILAKDQGDLWDSGDVASDQADHIAYAGAPLVSREACYWKVRATDSLGHTTAWSAPATWEMGLLQPADWQAKWIDVPPIMQVDAAPAGNYSIIHASYESTDSADAAASRDVTALVAGLLKDNTLSVPVNNVTLGGDVAHNHHKRLRVTYSVDGKQGEASANEDETLTLPAIRRSLPYLRKDFTVGKTVARARIYATALGLYKLRLNGQPVGDHIFAPDWTDYTKRVRYQVYDVTTLVKPGANTLGALVGNGWYCGHIGNGGFQSWRTVPALLAQMEVTYTDGTTDRIVTDSTWKQHSSPITDADIMLGENDDAQREIPGWDAPGLNTADWSPVNERTEAARPLDAQVDQPVRETGERAPRSMKEVQPGHWVFDLGQNMVGFVRLKVAAPAGTKITLRHAEMLNPDGTIYTRNLREAPAIDTYVCRGGGVETWQPSFTFHGFRYVELTGLPQAPGKDAVTGIVFGTDIPPGGQFSCSNADVNQLQSNIQWGMRGNYLSIPTDCPQRNERMGWMGDAQVFIRTAAYNGDVAAFFTKWLVDVDDAQSPEGRFSDVTPNPKGRGGSKGGVPAWGDGGVICPWTIYLMYDDKRILQQHLPAMMRWVDWCQANSTNLIRDRDRGADFGDWLSQHENTSKELIGTAFFAHSADIVAQACAVTGDTAHADKYRQLFDQVKAAFDQRYVTADGHLQQPTQCGYCLALRFGLLPDGLRAKAGQYLADDVAAQGGHLTTGFVGVSHLLPSLTAQGQLATAYRVFLQDTFPSWLFSVTQGATTIWERWDGWTPQKGFQNPAMNSFNHYSLGSCGEWMFDTVAGIGLDPAQPGFHHILIHPQPGGNLTWAAGTFDSIHGRIISKWALDGQKLTLHVTIPINTTATIELPTTDPASVRESGQEISAAPGITAQPDATGPAQYLVGSGDYTFTCIVP